MEPVNPDQPVDPKPLAELPDALTPPDCDLRDFPFMPLEVERLRRSKSWLIAKRQPELGFYQMNLWSASWHNVPAASVEDDDDVLADQAMCDPDRWPEVRDRVLRGWIKCSDGRLYHPVTAEKALEGWERKLSQRERGRKGNAVRWGSQKSAVAIAPGSSSDPSAIHEGSPGHPSGILEGSLHTRKGQRQGQGQGQRQEEASLRSAVSISDSGTSNLEQQTAEKKRKRDGLGRSGVKTDNGFSVFWERYPRKVGKGDAEKAWNKAVRDTPPDEILAGLGRAKWASDPQYIPHPSTWLNGKRWEDKPPPLPANVSVLRGAL